MSLFTLFVLAGFILKFISTIPNTRSLYLPEWPAWLSWTIAALLWALNQA